jgi:hypothetical protein
LRTPRHRSVSQELQSVNRSLTSIVRTIKRLGPALEAAARASGTPAIPRPPRKLSAERRAALQLQGQYIGHVRKLSPRQRARVKKLRLAKGVRAAIRFAIKLSGS